MGQLHIFSRNETQEQECTLLSKERCDPSQLKPKWKIWHSGWGFILTYNLVKPWITDKESVIIQKSQKADLQIDSSAFFFLSLKFVSSLLLFYCLSSEKFYYQYFFFPILNFLYHSLKLLFFSNSLFLYILVENSLQKGVLMTLFMLYGILQNHVHIS